MAITAPYNIQLLVRDNPSPLYEFYEEDGVVWESMDETETIEKLEELNDIYPKDKIRLIRNEQWFIEAALAPNQ